MVELYDRQRRAGVYGIMQVSNRREWSLQEDALILSVASFGVIRWMYRPNSSRAPLHRTHCVIVSVIDKPIRAAAPRTRLCFYSASARKLNRQQPGKKVADWLST